MNSTFRKRNSGAC